MADIQFDITLDLVEKYVPAENVTVVQEDYQSVKFVYTILNREQPVDLSGATDIVVSFVKPDGHIVLQNDGTLVGNTIELVANPQAFTYVGKTYFQVQYKIGSSIYNTRQAFLWVERGNTSCQTLSSTDFAPMLDQSIQAGQMLAGIDLQALIDSKVTAENAQADVDALELRVGALEVTIVGLDSRVDALETSQAIQDGKITTLETGLTSVGSNLSGLTARVTTNETAISGLQTSQATQDTKIATLETGQADLSSRVTSVEGNITTVVSEVDALQLTAVDHETRIDGLEANVPNLDPINTAITALQAKDVEQDGRIGANETAISGLQTKNNQQDTAIAGNATEIGNLQAEQTTQNNRLTAVENKNAAQDSAIGDIQAKDTQQDAAISALQSSQATQDTDIAAIKVKNTQQDTAISANASSIVAVDTKVDANKTAQDTINSGVSGSLSNHSTRIDTLEADATVDDARITNLEGDNTSNKNRIASVEGAIGVLNSDINDLQGNDAIQDSRLNAIEAKNTTQDGQIATNSSAIASNKADADSKITGLNTRLGTAETDIVNLKAKDTQQDTRMTDIENKDAQQDTRLTAIEGVNTAQNSRLDTIEAKNNQQDSTISVLQSTQITQGNNISTIQVKNTDQDERLSLLENSGDIIIPRHFKIFDKLKAKDIFAGGAIGDSNGAGVGASSYANNWIWKLTKKVQEYTNVGTTGQYAVKSYAVGSQNVMQSLPFLAYTINGKRTGDLNMKLKYPYLVVMVGLNDSNVNFVPLNEFEWIYRMTVRNAIENGIDVFCCTETCGVDMSTGNLKSTEENLYKPYREAIIKVASQEGASLVDLNLKFKQLHASGVDVRQYSADGTHLNDLGQNIVADLIFQCMSTPSLGGGTRSINLNEASKYKLVPKLYLDYDLSTNASYDTGVVLSNGGLRELNNKANHIRISSGGSVDFNIPSFPWYAIVVTVVMSASTGKMSIQSRSGFALAGAQNVTIPNTLGVNAETSLIFYSGSQESETRNAIKILASSGDVVLSGITILAPTLVAEHPTKPIANTEIGTWSNKNYTGDITNVWSSNTIGDKLIFKWYGTAIEFDSVLANICGQISITTDGEVFSRDMYTGGAMSVTVSNSKVFPLGWHTTTIEVLAKSASATDNYIGIRNVRVYSSKNNDNTIVARANTGVNVYTDILNNPTFVGGTLDYTLSNKTITVANDSVLEVKIK